MLTTVLIGAAGLLLLYVGGEGLVRGASSLALRFRVSPLVIGLTVVAFGTSAPELAVSVEASLGGVSDIALGNVIGSNIANIGLILGVTALVRATRVEARILKLDVPLMIAASLILVVALRDGGVSRVEGSLLILGLLAWVGFTAFEAQRESERVQHEFEAGVPPSPPGVLVPIVFVLIGLAALVVGGRLLIDSAVALASSMGVSQAVIGLTIVAVGTSLPEFAASVVAAVKGQGDIAVGNVVGSNLFNILGVLGIAAVVQPIGSGHVDGLTLLVFVGLAVLVVPLLFTGMELSRREGAGLLFVYGVYVVWLIAGPGEPGTGRQLSASPAAEAPYVVVLGVAQDGGVPQAGSVDHPGWDDPERRRLAVSLGLGATGVPVYAMPRMREFLASNGPWSQLVRYDNIELRELSAGTPVRVNERLSVTPFLVPQRSPGGT